MKFDNNGWYHIYNRGINRQKIFFNKENYLFFIQKLKRCFLEKQKEQEQEHAQLIAYCLMPNHFHLLIHTGKDYLGSDTTLHQSIGTMLSSYAFAVNNQQNRTGSLFQAKTKSKNLLTDCKGNYALICFHYIHQNPLRAGLVTDLKNWPYSSYLDYSGYRSGRLPHVQKGYEIFGFDDANHFRKLSRQMIADHHIRQLY